MEEEEEEEEEEEKEEEEEEEAKELLDFQEEICFVELIWFVLSVCFERMTGRREYFDLKKRNYDGNGENLAVTNLILFRLILQQIN